MATLAPGERSISLTWRSEAAQVSEMDRGCHGPRSARLSCKTSLNVSSRAAALARICPATRKHLVAPSATLDFENTSRALSMYYLAASRGRGAAQRSECAAACLPKTLNKKKRKKKAEGGFFPKHATKVTDNKISQTVASPFWGKEKKTLKQFSYFSFPVFPDPQEDTLQSKVHISNQHESCCVHFISPHVAFCVWAALTNSPALGTFSSQWDFPMVEQKGGKRT